MMDKGQNTFGYDNLNVALSQWILLQPEFVLIMGERSCDKHQYERKSKYTSNEWAQMNGRKKDRYVRDE